MTPLARRASLLVGFSLLASAATAHAEGAWVLWTRASESQDQLNQMASYESRQDCLNSAKEVAMRPGAIKGVDVKDLADVKDTKTFTGVTILETPKGWEQQWWNRGTRGNVTAIECWPDTVDPRGPKGK
jgi:hypothetical protein